MAFQRKPDEPKKGAPEFMNTYGDMVTLMLTFFVLLFAMSNLDEQKFNALRDSYAAAAKATIFQGMGGSLLTEAGPGIVQMPAAPDPADITVEGDDQDVVPGPEETGNSETVAVDQADADAIDELRGKQEELASMESDFKTYVAQNIIASRITVEMKESEYILITFPDGMLYDSGKADLKPEAVEVLDLVAEKLLEYSTHRIRVEGHTDDIPQRKDPYPSNRHLSSARADTVVEYLVNNFGFNPKAIAAEGMSEYWPIGDNGTEEGRAMNRRVEIKVYASQSASASRAIPFFE